jgi:hypothetical protein
MGYHKLQLNYFVANSTLGFGIVRGIQPILAGSLLSKEEFLRRGLVAEYMKGFLQSNTDVMMSEAESNALHNAKIIVGLTPEMELQQQAKLDADADDYEQAFKSASGVASDYARLFKSAMEDWNTLLQMYLTAKDRPIHGGHPEYQWFNGVKLGFEMDHLRSRFDIVENHLAKLLEPLKPAVVKLDGFHITNLQNFAGSLSIYSNAADPLNEHYTSAYYDADMFVHKLTDYEAGQKQKAEAEAKTKGWEGVNLNISLIYRATKSCMFFATASSVPVRQTKCKPPSAWLRLTPTPDPPTTSAAEFWESDVPTKIH